MNNSDEIDLLALVKVIWQKRKIIYSITFIFFVFGLSFSLIQSSPQFKSETSFLLKSGGSGVSNGMGSLGGLAALAGVNIPSTGLSSGTEITPDLYPKFISSIEFKKALIHAPLKLEGESREITYAYYYENIVKPSRLDLIKKYTIGLPTVILSMFNSNNRTDTVIENNSNLIKLSPTEIGHFERLDQQLSVDSKDGIMVLSFTMPDPIIAAQMANFAFQLLQKEIIDYKLGNLREELRFSESLYEEKKKEFEKIQMELSYFRDRNQNIITASVQNQQERLQAEYSLRFNVFNQVANTLESIKLQIARDTPIFSILDPVTIPNNPESNKRVLIILVSIILGFVVSFSYVLGVHLIKGVKEHWDKL